MKYYLVFAGDKYYPTGLDCQSIYTDEQKALDEAKRLTTSGSADYDTETTAEFDWSAVMKFDSETLEKEYIAELKRDDQSGLGGGRAKQW